MKRSVVPTNTKTIVKTSTIKDAGRGVFATVALEEGELVEVAPVLIIPKQDLPLIHSTILTNYVFADESDDSVDVLAFGHASMYNHSDRPNAEWAIGKGMIFVRATRAIEAGQEIFLDYGWDEDKQDELN